MATPQLRILFMGTPDFAAVTLRALLSGPDRVVGVVTQPDRPKGRGKKLAPPPAKVLALEAGLPVLQPLKIKTADFREELAGFAPDVVVVAAYGRILPPSLLELAPYGCLNVHGSLLPSHRGAAPIQWSIIKGDRQTGVTIMQMDEGMDTGAILLTQSLPIADDDTAGSLFPKVAELGGSAILRALELLKRGRLNPQPQDDSQATLAPMLKKEDGLIDWNLSAGKLHCHIRGLDPWPSAYCFVDGKRLRLFAPKVLHQDSDARPGTLLQADRRGLLVATGRNCLLITEIQPEGKKRMDVEAFLCGHPLEVGTLLTAS